MAKMVPGQWSDVNRSKAEEHVYERLAKTTPGDWIAVHSVGLTAHEFKSWAEADFVVIAPFGIVCIEVKGGVITTSAGQWFTNGKPLVESPFQQAGGAAAALRRDFRKEMPAMRHVRVEWAVAFPDCEIDVRGPGADQQLVYDARDSDRSFQNFLERTFNRWGTAHTARGQRKGPLTRAERSLVASWVAPTIRSVPSFRARLSSANAEFSDLTERQAGVLRGMRDEARVIVRGGAGTGKTLLAIQEAERLAADGQRVVLLCRSPALAGYIRELTTEFENLVVRDIRSLASEAIETVGISPDLPAADEQDLTTLFLPAAAADALVAADRGPLFDALVVDEAQDLLLPTIVDFIDVLIKHGLAKGTWRIFLDQKQNLFTSVDVDLLARIDGLAGSRAHLIDNCRNTPEVATSTALYSATQPDEIQAASGPEVTQHFIESTTAEREALSHLINDWHGRGIPLDDVVVLGPTDSPPPHFSAVFSGSYQGLRWVSIDDFKGREATAIIVTGISEFDSRESRRLAYVSCSRARWLLALIVPRAAEDSLIRRARGFGEMLAHSDDAHN